MPKDDSTQTGLGPGLATNDRPATARSKASVLLPLALAPPIAGTCWVVASSLSPWLVPPYLLLMAWFLLPTAGRHTDGRARGRSAGSTSDASTLSNGRGESAGEPGWTSQDSASGTSSASAGASDDDPGTSSIAAVAAPAKGRRGKGRSRKPKPSPELPEATWIEVGPGKFVRAEASARAAEAGPHAFVEGRPEAADSTPHTPSEDEPDGDRSDEPLDETEDPRGSDVAPEGHADLGTLPAVAPLSEGEGPEPSPEIEANPESAPPAPDEGPSTVDGTMPQVAGPFVVEDRAGPEAGSEAADARDRADRAFDGPEVDPFAATDPDGSPEVAELAPLLTEGASPAVPAPLGVEEVWALRPGPPAADPLADEPEFGAEAVFNDAAEAPQGQEQAEGIPEVETSEGDPTSDPEGFAEPGRTEVTTEEADATRWEPAGWPESPEGLASETFTGEDEPNADLAFESTELAEDDDFDRPDPSPDEADQPVASDGPSWWPRPWSKAHRTRPGFRALANPAAMPPRHLGRSRVAPRPPADPRRPSRRGLSRPRQGSRTFPPRSPPRGRSGWGR